MTLVQVWVLFLVSTLITILALFLVSILVLVLLRLCGFSDMLSARLVLCVFLLKV